MSADTEPTGSEDDPEPEFPESVPVDAICVGCKDVKSCTAPGEVLGDRTTFWTRCMACHGEEPHNVVAILKGRMDNPGEWL